MEKKEQELQRKKTMPQEAQAGRTTHGVNNTSKYAELLSKKSREDRIHDQNTEAVFEAQFHIGCN